MELKNKLKKLELEKKISKEQEITKQREKRNGYQYKS